MLREGKGEGDLSRAIDEIKEKHSDYGPTRRSSILFHLETIENLLKPTTTTTVAMRAIENSDKEGADRNDNGQETGYNKLASKSLFSLLSKHLDITEEQETALRDSRFIAKVRELWCDARDVVWCAVHVVLFLPSSLLHFQPLFLLLSFSSGTRFRLCINIAPGDGVTW